MLLYPRLGGAEFEAGRIGSRPVGVPRRRGILNADYAVPGVGGVSLDAAFTYIGSRPARSAPAAAGGKQLEVQPLATLNLGARYRFRMAGHDVTARAQVQNVFGQYSWEVNSSETLAYSLPRRVRLVLTGEF